MEQSWLQASTWCKAMTLKERFALLHDVKNRELQVSQINPELAKQRWQRWRSQTPFQTDSYLQQRLATDGLSEDDFFYLLGERTDSLHSRCSTLPTWLTELAQAFSRPPSPHPYAVFPVELPQGQEIIQFLEPIEPLISKGRDRLQQGIQQLSQTNSYLPFDPETVETIFLTQLTLELLPMLNPTLVLELHIARLQEQLAGDTPNERFQSFIQRLRQRDTALALLQDYPVLARQVTLHIEQWVSFSLEFLSHLCVDWQSICTQLSPGTDLGVLVALEYYSGGRHWGGKTVTIARFSSQFQVVYKPKSLAVENHFQELLLWINQRGKHPAFRTLKIIDRTSYGWMEFVAAADCTCEAEVGRFYERQGAYLALLYALRGTDLHFENIIAAGEHPMLVDVEMLFQPVLDPHTNGYSVLEVGLLPVAEETKSEGADLSGLGASGQVVSDQIAYWQNVGTDQMQLARQQVELEMPGAKNLPTLNGTQFIADKYIDAIAFGFTNLYQLLCQHRDELLADDGFLARFASDPIRVVLRPWIVYKRLQMDSFHPDLMRNALERDRLFDRLWVAVQLHPPLSEVIPFEREDLYQGDIPIFTTRPNSRHLWNSRQEQITDFFTQTGMMLVKQHIQQLSEFDLVRQLTLTKAALITDELN